MTNDQRNRAEAAKRKADQQRADNRKATSNQTRAAEKKAGSQPPPRDPNEVDVYYEADRDKFWAKNADDEWMKWSKAHLDMYLRSNWYSQYEKSTNSLTRVEEKLLKIIMHNNVKYAGELAGWSPGMHTICGYKVLVSRGPSIPTPKRGRWPLIHRLIDELFGEEAKYFYAWMLAAFKSLQAGPPFGPGQLLAIAGPTNCGKSLLQCLITEMLGGRHCKPYDYLMGLTAFNDTMIGSEHLVLDDEVGKADIRTRRAFGTKLKATIANQNANAHPKGGKMFNIEPFWRITMTLNDEPENLMALPPIDGDIDDKIILLKASEATMPFPSKEIPTRQAYWDALKAEVPHYLFSLLKKEMPPELHDLRFGVRAYQNADLLFALSSLSPESKLWTLITQSGLLDNYSQGWTGTATDLEMALQKTPLSRQVENLLYYPTACGYYLTRLVRTMPGNVHKEELPNRKIIYHLVVS